MSEQVVLVATMVAKPGREELVEQTFKAAMAAVHAEPGCLRYALHRKAGTTGEFVMIEKWASREALGAHMKGAAMREIGAALAQALAGPPDMVFLDAIPAGDPDLGAV
ncbi:antibiotic biosynthesis monooxygenase [Streptomyces sp. ID05-04B]|uniref:putative quinol monooxygenase n=1 Tax=unclassified Streptomyces TaxID=2593676 RepID=UPI000D1B6DC4|nr:MULTISPECIES: antibiotic biosynthesis monooxygenase family protein [unclassified Streptomyces]AVV45901.1 antibiotic biosynthesis monooxygenase [Streptomyces sp. P3]MDX5565553.1 antibiotic biosynthesis monooxygenase [Streptomyces sp. ID05-04B]